ncbi:MAG: ABC transporter substrate-binding protein [Methylobacteriaceae bacterium]|nr:ABC transporter substrate-binding protein [Methylobacteriaceae bacterium]
MIVAKVSYDTRTPTVDSQVVQIKSAGADVMMDFTTPKFSTQAIRKIAEMKWNPLQFVASVGSHVGSVLKPAGFDNSKGVITGHWVKDPNDPPWRRRRREEWRDFASIIRAAIRRTTSTSSPMCWLRRSNRFCASAATISRART